MTVGKSSGIATILSPKHYMGIFPYMPFKPLQHPGRNAVRTGSHGLTPSSLDLVMPRGFLQGSSCPS
jgi:hypothetical protein